MAKKLSLVFMVVAFCTVALAQIPGVADRRTSGTSEDSSTARVPGMQMPRPEMPSISVDEINVIDGDASDQRLRRTEPSGPFRVKEDPRTDFQKFVLEATGLDLPVYGHDLFANVPSTFAPLDRVPVPADYVVGPGDEIVLRVWGQVNINARLTVDRSGQVYLPKVGALDVAGVKYDELSQFLKEAIGRIFRNFEMTASLGRLRSIQVFVVGHARRPGSYTVSSLSTLVNALFASGGPSVSGSLRNVQLKRSNRVVTTFDLYDLLANGDKSRDVVLHPGDVIYIPPASSMVALVGSVNIPAIYELKPETTLKDELAIAGGLSTVASESRVSLERIDKRSKRTIEEFTLNDQGLSRKLQDGDMVRIFPVSPKIENAVTLRGNVTDPGRYAWRPSMRVRDLIPSREFLITRNYWRAQNALGTDSLHSHSSIGDTDENEQSPYDGVRTDQSEYNESGGDGPKLRARQTTQAKLAGDTEKVEELRESQKRTSKVTNKIRTDLKRNAAEINWDYAVVQRLNGIDLSTRLLPFNLGNAIKDVDSEDNLLLEPGDVVTIFSQRDIAMPRAKQTKYVRIEGEVNAAGVYRVEPGETLRDLVQRAGGLTTAAYVFAADFRRESARLEQKKQLDALIERTEKELQAQMVGNAARSAEEQRAAREQIEMQRTLLEKMKSAEPTGRVVLEIKPGEMTAAALPPLELEDGDRLQVPARPATVDVVGAVYNQNSFIHRNSKRVREYLKDAGGATRDADTGRLFIIRADGSVLSKQAKGGWWSGGIETTSLMPGDTVVMPNKMRTGATLRGIRDWSQVFSQFALGAAAINVVR